MILFTADWHIKLGQKNVPRDWAVNRYRMFFQQLEAIEETGDVSLHIVGGDLFDRLPNMEELELYFEWVSGVTVPTIVFDGNHEATKKNHTFFDQLKQATSKINPLVTVITESYVDEKLGFGILPYADLHKKDAIENFFCECLFTHVRGEIPPHVKPEIQLERFDRFKVVFAGDLHAHSNTQRNIVYPGSPMTTSFHRNEVTTGFLLIDESDWSWTWKEFDLPQLIRKTVRKPEEMIPTQFHHTIYEIEGDIQELAAISNSDLLDKKVVKRASEATLVLEKDATIEEELVEYLTYILELNEDRIPQIIGTFNDYASKVEME